MSQAPHAPRWYREPWPWIVMSGPAVAVVFSCYAAFLAVHGADPVIDGDYYRRGLAINEELGRGQHAEALGLAARVALDGLGGGDAVRLELTSAQGALPDDPTIRLRLIHPSREAADRTATLVRGRSAAGGVEYVGAWQTAENVAVAVAWRAVVEGRQWRIESAAPAMAANVERRELTLAARR